MGQAILNASTGWRFRVDDFSGLLAAIPVEVVQKWLSTAGVMGARGLARHLEPPHLDTEGRPVVPALTAFVLEQFADDDQVFREFCAGTHSGQIYCGDIAAAHEQEAELGRRFLGHPVKRVRDWALFEIKSARQEAAYWRQHEEEMVEH